MAYGKVEEILVDFASSGALAASTPVLTSPVQQSSNPGGTNGTLNTNELGELLSDELTPPFDGNGNEQLLDDVRLILDGTDASTSWWKTSGRASLLSTPPGAQTVDSLPGQGGPGTRVYFSPTGYGGIGEAVKILANPLPGEEPPDTMGRALVAAAVPRYQKRAIIQYVAGAAAVTSQWLDRWWGHRYQQAEVDDLYGGVTLGGHVRFTDPFGPKGHRTIEFDVPTVKVGSANWGNLPGAPSAPVKPFRRWAIASTASAGNMAEFDFTYSGASTSQVAEEHQSLDFDLSNDTSTVYVFYQFMVRALQMSEAAAPVDLSVSAQNIATQYLRQQGYQPSAIVPKNALPASDVDNPQLAGWTYPTAAGNKKPATYKVVRPLSTAWRVIAGVRATVAFSDNGTPQPANTIGALLGGTLFSGVTNLKFS